MPNDTIYDEKEIPKLKEITNETLRAKLDEFCEKFLAAQSLDELGALDAEGMKYLVSIINPENKLEVIKFMEIMEAVHLRAAVEIVLKDIKITSDEPEKA